MDIDINQYLSIFVEESKEHLQVMNDVLLELEKHPENIDHINEIFRVAHTLKGMSGTMGFQNMAELTHQMENLLQVVKTGEMKLTEDIIDVLFKCFDELGLYVQHIIDEGTEITSKNEELINSIVAILNGGISTNEEDKKDTISNNSELDDVVNNLIKTASEEDLNTFEIRFFLEEDCMLKAARAFIAFKTLEEMGEIIQSEPSVESIEDEEFENEFSVVFITKEDEKELQNKLGDISEIKAIKISKVIGNQEKIEESKENVEKNIEDIVSEDKIQNNIDETNNYIPSNEDQELESKMKVKTIKPKETTGPKIKKTVRVDIERLDNLMNLVSELIIIKTRMDDIFAEQKDKNNITETVEYLDRITTSIHDVVMKVRMVPIERVFNRFPRYVRDLAKDLNKEINLSMLGEETEVDRTIIDEIGDPLIHLIRNSLDHGVELPEERVSQGKARAGQVILQAYPDGNNVVIEVSDDGRGIDPELVKAKAIEKDIISQAELENLTDEDAIMLLFRSGLSTSEEISDVSGRGVGLDVVKSKIESINGSIEVKTEMGKGSKFIIRIPLTLAIIQALMVKLGTEIYAIPLSTITEITTLSKELINSVQGQEVVIYRGKTIPIIRLGEVLQVENVNNNEDNQLMVVVNKGEKQAGLIVDDLIAQQEIVIKSLGTYLNDIKYISGATILGDGSISLIIDVNSLV